MIEVDADRRGLADLLPDHFQSHLPEKTGGPEEGFAGRQGDGVPHVGLTASVLCGVGDFFACGVGPPGLVGPID